MTSSRWVLAGWLMFTISGVFFLIDALESGDKTALGSAVTWLLGVAFFLFAGRGLEIDPQEEEQAPTQS